MYKRQIYGGSGGGEVAFDRRSEAAPPPPMVVVISWLSYRDVETRVGENRCFDPAWYRSMEDTSQGRSHILPDRVIRGGKGGEEGKGTICRLAMIGAA